jgi:hypothetical protein
MSESCTNSCPDYIALIEESEGAEYEAVVLRDYPKLVGEFAEQTKEYDARLAQFRERCQDCPGPIPRVINKPPLLACLSRIAGLPATTIDGYYCFMNPAATTQPPQSGVADS